MLINIGGPRYVTKEFLSRESLAKICAMPLLHGLHHWRPRKSEKLAAVIQDRWPSNDIGRSGVSQSRLVVGRLDWRGLTDLPQENDNLRRRENYQDRGEGKIYDYKGRSIHKLIPPIISQSGYYLTTMTTVSTIKHIELAPCSMYRERSINSRLSVPEDTLILQLQSRGGKSSFCSFCLNEKACNWYYNATLYGGCKLPLQTY